jgi:hypothetical protein
MIELTGEYLVTKYPDRFSQEAVRAASVRMAEANNGQCESGGNG